MVREGFIYDRICDIDNIKKAIMEASKEKRDEYHVKLVLDNIDEYALKLQDILIRRKYKPSKYAIEIIVDGLSGKERKLYKPKFFPDQCIHWALMLQVEPNFMKGMYAYSCGSIGGRGTLHAKNFTENVIRNDHKNTKYCLKADIYHFYQSCSHNVLKGKLRRLFKDPYVLDLFDRIIDSVPEVDGLPLGNYTSQWLGNLMLTDMDHYIKEVLHIPHYVRYADDIVLFSGNKKQLHKAKDILETRLWREEGLILKKNWQVFRVEYYDKEDKCYYGRKVDFVGYAIGRDTTRIRKRIMARFMVNIEALANGHYTFEECARYMAYNGYLTHSDSTRFVDKYIRDRVSVNRVRSVISNHFKEMNRNIKHLELYA